MKNELKNDRLTFQKRLTSLQSYPYGPALLPHFAFYLNKNLSSSFYWENKFMFYPSPVLFIFFPSSTSSFVKLSQGRIQGGAGGHLPPPLTDFKAKNVPNLINHMCFSISSYLIIFYLLPARREVQGINIFDKGDCRLYFKGTVDSILNRL